MRLAAILEYDGSRFSGWQRQTSARSIQAEVESAFSRVADHPVAVTVAGRTDAGVHALAQTIHFDTTAVRPMHSWLRGANTLLPPEIAVLAVVEVDPAFHARFAATGRRYDYLILNRPVRPTILSGRVTHDYRPLDIARMQQAARLLEGEHDFTSYRSIQCQARNPVRQMRELSVERHGEFIRIHAHANAFLHHMVRNLAGVLTAVGAGEREPDWAREVLRARDRTQGGVTAPPDGLYLAEAAYPVETGIPRIRGAAWWEALSADPGDGG